MPPRLAFRLPPLPSAPPVALVWLLSIGLAATGTLADKPAQGVPQDQYLVIPFPAEHPEDEGGDQIILTGPAEAQASPFGWHDIDGIPGPEFNDTRGNNAEVQDLDGFRPTGGPGPELVFDYPLDLELPPDEGTNLEASIVAFFYNLNYLHDFAARYGFDEVSGNFQTFNYSGQGSGGDAVVATVQRGIACDAFSTPPEGGAPIQNACIWQPTAALVDVTAPAAIAGPKLAGIAEFGEPLDTVGIVGTLALVDDGVGTPTDGCEASTPGSLAGLVAVVDRGGCEFSAKVLHAEEAGAIAAIVINNQGNGLLDMGPGSVGGQVTIPSLFIGQTDGESIKGQLPAPGVEANLRLVSDIARDAAHDKGIVAYGYTQGITMRLTGGAGNVNCLNGSEQPGGGWSDYMHLVTTAKATDQPTTHRAIATWVLGQTDDGPGIRNFPYTTDLALNPLTYSDIASTQIPHGVGEVWASMLWEVYWELVLRYGYDEDLLTGSGGNNLAIQLVFDGLKLQGCNPTFVDARDGILQADNVLTGGANQCEIWRGFAKRGLGLNASSGTFNVGDEVEAFDLPAGCSATIFADGFESGGCAAWSGSSPTCN